MKENAYEMPWRTNYEAMAAAGWLVGATGAIAAEMLTELPPEPFWWMTGISSGMALYRLPEAYRLHKLQKGLKGKPLAFMELSHLQKVMAKHPDELWLGYGFEWDQRHAQRAYEILKRDKQTLLNQGHGKQMGSTWIHGVEPKEEDVYQPVGHTEGHTLIVGTTGAGKTRCFDAMITQAILRNEAVIIIDPKGDKELKDNAQRACIAAGSPERFVYFHPGFPEHSVRLNLLRTRLTYSKFTNKQIEQSGQAYSHLTFFRNNSKVDCTEVDIDTMESGVAAGGLLSGEASQSRQGSYYTGFGLKNVDYSDKPHLKVAKSIGSLIKPALGKNVQYHGKNAVSLAVSEDFRALLKHSYDSSIWTTIIDPKVTLDFFHSNEDVVLIHYSDQYTTSSSYDAITVTAQRHLFEKVLSQQNGGFVDEFNAFNGDWLLKMISAPTNGHKSVEQFERLRKERRGIIGAYKFVTSMLSQSDITWVPLSVAEMIRVSGNLGLKMSDSEFSRNVNGYRQGAISDDVLMVGLKDQTMYLLPLEVKTGAIPNYAKAIEQAKELGRYLREDILGGSGIVPQLYRSLFIRQILMQ
ncbi:type IV secretion system DNA-binding domain-containing protein, partial [Vibrio cholerae]